MKKTRSPLGLEALEDRWVPATIRFDGSNLFITNPLITGAGTSSLKVTETGVNAFQVMDNGNNNGTFLVSGNITINGNNAKDNIAVMVNGSGLQGNLNVRTGNGASSVTVDGNGVPAAFIAGNTFVNVGNGTSTVGIGATNGVTDKGSLFVYARGTGANSVTVGGGGSPSSVLGNAQLYGFPNVSLGGTAGDRFAGNVSVNTANNNQTETITLKTGTQVQGNFSVTGGNGATALTINGGISGLVSVNLGNGANAIVLSGGGKGLTFGNFNLNAGNGANTVTTNATTVLGNVNVNLGNGLNTLGTSTGLTVNGDVNLRTGNGGLDAATNSFQGVVFGNLNVFAGNGNNSFTFGGDKGASVFGTFNYNGGNGGNSVTVNNTTANTVQLNVRFGNSPGVGAGGSGNNVFTIGAGATPGTLTGLVAWGVPTLAANGNAFVDNGYVFTNNITLINVPS